MKISCSVRTVKPYAPAPHRSVATTSTTITNIFDPNTIRVSSLPISCLAALELGEVPASLPPVDVRRSSESDSTSEFNPNSENLLKSSDVLSSIVLEPFPSDVTLPLFVLFLLLFTLNRRSFFDGC